MTVYEYDGRLLVVDCGVLFPEDAQPGVDLILPDLRLVEDRVDDIDAVVITHGHEDHIGALPWLLRLRKDLPVIGAKFSLALIAAKCREHRITPEARGGRRGGAAQGRRLGSRVLRGQPLHPGRARRRHPDAGRHRAAHRRHQARPATTRRPAHRPRRLLPARRRGRRPVPGRLHQRRGARVRRAGARDRPGAGQLHPVGQAAGHRRQLRLPRAPGPADARRRPEPRPQGRVRRPVDGAQHADRPGTGPAGGARTAWSARWTRSSSCRRSRCC